MKMHQRTSLALATALVLALLSCSPADRDGSGPEAVLSEGGTRGGSPGNAGGISGEAGHGSVGAPAGNSDARLAGDAGVGTDAAPRFEDAGAGAMTQVSADAQISSGSDGGTASYPPLLTVFNTDVLHEVIITVDLQYLSKLDSTRGADVPGTMTFDGKKFDMIAVSKKGGYSFDTPLAKKPSFTLKMDTFNVKQRISGLDKFALESGRQDSAFLGEHLGYEIYRRMKVPAAYTAHAVVTFNGIAKGIFTIKESEDRDFLQRNFGKGNELGNLYQVLCNPPVNPCPDFVTKNSPKDLELKHEMDEMRKRDDLLALAKAVKDTPVGDAFVTAVGARLDWDAFIAGMAIDVLTVHHDGYSFTVNNYIMYDRTTDNRFVFIPHGMDSLFEVDAFLGPSHQKLDPYTSKPPGILAQKVHAVPSLDKRYQDYIQRVLKEAWDVPALTAIIDKVAKVLHSTTRTDAATKADLKRFDDNVNTIKAFIVARKAKYLKP